MTEQNMTNWLTQENERLKASRPNIEQLESLKMLEGQIVKFEVDFSQPFDKWIDPTDDNLVKKIIPVTHNGQRKNFWINVKNPLYSEIIQSGVEGVTEFEVLQIGSGKTTKYQIVKTEKAGEVEDARGYPN